MQVLHLGSHTAYLDPMTGEGLLTIPDPRTDVRIGLDSIHAASWDDAITRLDALGWEPTEDECGGVFIVGRTAAGEDLIGLYGRDSIIGNASLDEVAQASSALLIIATESQSR